MIVLEIILIIIGIVVFYYSFKFDDLRFVVLLTISIILLGFGIILIANNTNNSKSKEKEIKFVKYYNIKSTIIIVDNIPIDTIYTIYYKKK